MDLTRLLELLKLRPEALLGIFLCTGILVVLPEDALTKLGLLTFVSTLRGWLGGAFVYSTTFLLANGLSAAFRQARRYISVMNESKARRESFKYLSPPEKELLAKYINEKTTTQYFVPGDGIASGLQVQGFIYRASNVGTSHSFAFNIQPWAWKCLQDNPSLVLGETATHGQ